MQTQQLLVRGYHGRFLVLKCLGPSFIPLALAAASGVAEDWQNASKAFVLFMADSS